MQKLKLIKRKASKHPRSSAAEDRRGEFVHADWKSLVICSTPEARAIIGYDQAERLGALPLGILNLSGQRFLTVAVEDPSDIKLEKTLRFACGIEVKLIGAEKTTLEKALFRAYHGDSDALTRTVQSIASKASEYREVSNELLSFRPDSGDASKLLAALVDYSISQGASDLHLIPMQDGTHVKIRINGELLERYGALCTKTLHTQLASRVKVLSSLDTTQQHRPQDGSFMVDVGQSKVHVRVSVMPTIHGEKVVLRFLGCHGFIALEDLGLDDATRFFIEAVMIKREGAILFGGMTGSGKTTTMYAVLDAIRRHGLSLVSIEDPVEFHLEGVSQTSIDPARNFDYGHCLRSILRQDPDVIMVGELRDTESARTAFQAAITGHLLLSSVHARNVFETFLRLTHLGIDALSLSQGLELIVSQSLYSKLCERCKVIDLSGSNQIGVEVYKQVGCPECDYSGYDGRALATEALMLDSTVRAELCRGSFARDCLKPILSDKNYHPLRSSIENLLRDGKIALNQCATDLACD